MKKPAVKTKKSVYCQNCDTRFKGNYCPNCGQQFKEFQKPFKFLIIDLAANVVSFDTRLWRSLKSLITKPGSYALDYINGHRMRYVPPLRLYVFISFLFFLLFSIFINRNIIISEETKSSINSEIENGLKDEDISVDMGILNIEGDNDTFEEAEIVKIVKAVINDPSRYMNSFLTFVSWTLFLLMPLYAFILWLFFRKNQPYYYCHLIFAVNQHAFIFLLGAFVLGIDLLFPNRSSQPEIYLLWLIPIYMFIGKKQLYYKGWTATFFRMLAAFFLYLILFMLTIILLFALWFNMKFM